MGQANGATPEVVAQVTITLMEGGQLALQVNAPGTATILMMLDVARQQAIERGVKEEAEKRRSAVQLAPPGLFIPRN